MKTTLSRSTLLVLALLLVTTVSVRASGPVGLYAVIERVTFEPNEAAAERVQVWGAFSFVQGGARNPFLTAAPERGSIYFEVPANSTDAQKKAIQKEWIDLKAVAGTGQAVGFGSWHYSGAFQGGTKNLNVMVGTTPEERSRPVHILKASEPKGIPVEYKTDSGVVKLPATGSHATVVGQLKGLLK